ncbi:neogenin isoform X3 [Danio rerio]|uniref:Neogenin isoform X3 n=1 Tax=Danio rerio TaxID=7955 RepID=A0A8M6YW07_DANRE|nr:neogenin isoform X2 [Danio rerio]|eukprot:XP_017209685.1 neogenin isoform X2 [Danio rerio]
MAEREQRLLVFFTSLIVLRFGGADKGSAIRGFTPFRFSVEPVDVLAVRGLPAVLNCSAISDAPVRVEWKKDGTFLNLVADDRRRQLADGSLLISTVVHSKHNKPDEGVYQCVATIDNLGTISSRTARLTVAGLPRFLSQPEGVSVRSGGTEMLSCEVTEELVPFTRWDRDARPVELDSRVIQLPSGALVISNASQADAGLYRCTIDGLGPPKTTEEAELQVVTDSGAGEKLETLQGPVAVAKVVGESVLLPCVMKGHPIPAIRWTFNDQPIEEAHERFSVIGGGSLQIVNLTEEDAGIYVCQADSGNMTSEIQAELTVHVPPRFLTRPSNTYAQESMDIIFECDVTGSPPPTVKWMKDGDTVIPSDYFRIVKQHNLQVLGLVKSDEGFYQCLAENDAGNVQASAQLIILDIASSGSERSGPTPSAPRDVVASLVSTRFIKLTWRLPAEPHGENITYSVFYSLDGTNRERVENTSAPGEMQVTIQNLIPDTKYSFRVVASNANGPGESSAPLTVATQLEVQVPGPAPNLQVVSVGSSTVSLSWERPITGNGEIQTYKLFYIEKGQESEQDVDVSGLSYTMTSLKKFTEYSFRVVAYNKHGPGVSTEDVTVRTLSDVPSAAPQNLTLDVLNSTSIMVRWQPPPAGSLNGELTGYKLRYRKGLRRADAVEISTMQIFQLIDGLERGKVYTVRVSATTVNGTGPATEWSAAETFESDLDESQVPGVPSSLHVRPLVNRIVVSWTPPENQEVLVRGYKIGYGIGSPHAHTVTLDYKQRFYSIDNLDASSHYVITLKAYNNMGEGVPIYNSATTRPQSDPVDPDIDFYELFNNPYTPAPDPTPMLPPVGVQASVLSHDTVKVSWADNSLAKNQKITDARYYTIRWKTNIPANTKYKMANTTSLFHTVSALKPNTLYEFSVMVTKNRRSSTWSMTAHSTTHESIPSSAPKDVTVISKEGNPRIININWQPPTEANGKITGYIIYYSTDVNAEVHDWVVEPVVGNRLTHQIQGLTLDTSYFFKIQARNSKGMGPMSDAVQFRTPKAEPSDKMSSDQGLQVKPGHPTLPEHGSGSNMDKQGITGSQENHILVIVVIVSVGVFTIIAVVVGAVLCTRRSNSHQKKKRAACKSSTSSHKYKSSSKDLKPPDLWIHHERLELKPMDKSPEPNPVMTETPIPRSVQEPAVETSHQRRGHDMEDSVSTLPGRRAVRPKMMMPFDSQPPQPVISAHPIHSLDHLHHHHHHYHLPPRGYLHHQISLRAPATTHTHSERAAESARNQPAAPEPPVAPSQPITTAELQKPTEVIKEEESPGVNPPTAHVRPTHPLKSFAVPTVTVSAHSPSTYDSTLPSTPLLAQPGAAGKTASIGTLSRARAPMAVTVPSAPDQSETSKMLDMTFETDELSEEMAHLEGLMKDLNAITTG